MNSSKVALVLMFTLSTMAFAQQAPSSKVVFVRNLKWFGWTVGYNIFKGESKLTRIKPHTAAVIDMLAEPTQVWAKTEVKRSLDLDLQANRIYFVECSLGLGLFLSRPRLKAISLSEFQQLYARRKYVRKQLAKQGYTSLEALINGYQAQLAINQVKSSNK